MGPLLTSFYCTDYLQQLELLYYARALGFRLYVGLDFFWFYLSISFFLLGILSLFIPVCSFVLFVSLFTGIEKQIYGCLLTFIAASLLETAGFQVNIT